MLATLLVLVFQGEKIEQLIGQLGSEDVEVRERTSSSLAAVGWLAVPALLGAQRSLDPEICARVLNLLDGFPVTPATSLHLLLEKPTSRNDLTEITLNARNITAVPVIVYIPGLNVTGLVERSPAPAYYDWIQPNETIRVCLSGNRIAPDVPPIPYYHDPREVSTTGYPVWSFRLQNAEPDEAAETLRAAFKTRASKHLPSTETIVEIAVDDLTKSIVVRGATHFLEAARKIVTKLDETQLNGRGLSAPGVASSRKRPE